MKFGQITFVTTSALDLYHAGQENTPGTDQNLITAQTTGPERICMESSDRIESWGSLLLREFGDTEQFTATSMIVNHIE